MPLTCKIPSGKGHQPMREAFLSHIDALSKMQEFLGTLEGCFFPVAHKKQLFLHTGFGGYSRRCLWKLCCGICACGSGVKESYGYKKRVSLIYRTATTTYPCCLPALGEFCRSWSYMTYPTAKVSNFPLKTSLYALIL